MARPGLGKIRSLTALSAATGTFHILACDQRGAMRRLIEAGGGEATHERVVRLKLDIVGVLSPLATGVLLDPEYGAGAAVAERALSGRAGLVVAVEETGYAEVAGERHSRLLDGWGVEKVKAMGAAAAKLLVYFNPRREAAARAQEALVEQVAAACRRLDLPLMLECLVYPTDAAAPPEAFLREREDLIVESARALSRFDVDLYKAEFPRHPALEGGERERRRACERLTEACRVPWAVLSAGVDFSTYARQVEEACQAGASGFVGGRAIWREAATLPEGPERERFLRGEMVRRFEHLAEIAAAHGRPWHRVPSHAYEPGDVAPAGWYRAYME